MVGSSAPWRLRKRSKIEGSTTRSMITRGGGRSTRGAHSAGLSRFPNSRSVARSATLSGLAALPPPYVSDEPARLSRVCSFSILPTRSNLPSATQPTQVAPVCHFPTIAVKWSHRKNLPPANAWARSRRTEFNPRRCDSWRMGFVSPISRPGGVTPATRLSPAGESPHSDSFQIKQQHCEVRRGDAADAARLAQTCRPNPRQLLARLESQLRNRVVSRSAAGCACPSIRRNRSTSAACRSM